ncbi:MAG: hypothetical protein GY810_20685 [Aureispira sp.]|nr:hypothetical protein [Aureispira sp.]
MNKTLTSLLLGGYFCVSTAMVGQLKLSKEEVSTPPKFSKSSYLGNISYNEDGTTTLHYVEKQPFNMFFKNYTYDSDFKLVNHDIDDYPLGQQIKDAWKDKFSWFRYVGDEYQVEGVSVDPTWGGKLIARKKLTTWKYSPLFGGYYPTVRTMDVEKLSGADDNRIFLYHRAEDYEKGNVLLLVGNKAEKGSKIKNQHTRNFQLMTVSKNLEVVYGEEIKFDYAVCVNYARIIDEPGLGESNVDDEIGDLSRGDLAIVFSPMNAMITKKMTHDNPAEHTIVIVSAEGKIKSKITIKAPSSGWWIEDIIKFDSGEIFAYGPSKDEKYINTLKPTNSPATFRQSTSETKWKSFQVMKLNKDLELEYIEATALEEFKDKLVTPPSQKKSPSYIGKRFDKRQLMLTPNGDLLITGQKWIWKKIPKVDENGKTVVNSEGKTVYTKVKSYGDLVMFHFGNKGKLKAQYGIRRDRMNKYSRRIITPTDLYLGKDDNTVYWVYGEIKGFRKGFVFDLIGYVATVNKRKLLYYPTVAKVSLDQGKISDFTPLGQDEKGKQIYYTNPEFPQLYVPGSHLTFIGEDKKGKQIWFGRLDLE